MTEGVRPGAEPFSAPGGPSGVLVLHGFTGCPQSVRPLAEAVAGAGFTVELPLLPGHGTRVEDLCETTWADWSAAAERAYQDLAGRSRHVVVAGLSMGGTLACWLAVRHPEIAGLVCVNPAVEAPAPSFLDLLQAFVDAGELMMPSIGSDIARPGVVELAYEVTPVAALLSLMGAVAELEPRLGEVRCPLLLFSSREDHVVPVSAGDLLEARVSGPVERVRCGRSYHVATLDYDGPDIAARTVAFATRVTGGMALGRGVEEAAS
jgi:carboxylesterase